MWFMLLIILKLQLHINLNHIVSTVLLFTLHLHSLKEQLHSLLCWKWMDGTLSQNKGKNPL